MGIAEEAKSPSSESLQLNSNQHSTDGSSARDQDKIKKVTNISNGTFVKKKLEQFKKLTTLGNDEYDALLLPKEYDALLPHIKVYETQLALVERVKLKAFLFVLVVFLLPIGIIYLIFQNSLNAVVTSQVGNILSLFGTYFDNTLSPHAVLQTIIIIGIGIMELIILVWPYNSIFMPLFRLPANFWQNMFIHWGWFITILSANILLVYFIKVYLTKISPILRDVELALLICISIGVSCFILVLTYLIVYRVFSYEFERWSNGAYPVASLINNLILLLDYAKKDKGKWFKSEVTLPGNTQLPEDERVKAKKKLLSQIEKTASCFSYLILHFQTGDFATNYWMSQTAERAAAALRDKKKWILTPNEFTTYNDFVERIKEILKNVVNGTWDAIELMGEEEFKKLPSPPKRSWHDHMPTLLKLFLIAALPVVSFIILQFTPWHLTGTTRDYVIVGLLIWILLTILTELDPKLKDKTDIIGFTGFLKSKQDKTS